MSGPRRPSPRPKTLSRRDFLKRAGFGSALASALPLAQGCSSSVPADGGRAPSDTGVEFRHGVASGDPLGDRVILWTRVSGLSYGGVIVDYAVYADPEMKQLVTSGSELTSEYRDYTVKVDVTGLQPGTTYYYQFRSGDAESLVGRTRTAPADGMDRARIGVVSCSSLAHGYFNAYRKLAQRADLDVVVHLGDYIYEYGTGEYGDVREYQPAHEIIALEDYRTRHAQYKLDADLQEVHRQHPFINVWDDHESANNSWMGGAENHSDDEGSWDQRKAWAIQAYYEWLPIRAVDESRPERIYRSFRYGDLLDLIMLDTRLIGRDEEAGLLNAGSMNDEDRQLLGTEQLAWLYGELAQSGVTWKLLGQQVMFGQLRIPSLPELSALVNLPVDVLEQLLDGLPIVSTGGLVINPDQWDGYRAERERVFQALENLNIDNAVVLTGDIHTSWSMDLSRDPANPLVYNAVTGSGSLGVEFVCTSVTSPGLEAAASLTPLLQLLNPHMKYVDLAQKGYLLLDVTPERLVGEHWYVDTVTELSDNEAFGTAYAVEAGSKHLVTAERTASLDNPPPLAP